MKICKKCNVTMSDDIEKCLLCGSNVEHCEQECQIKESQYPKKIIDTSPKVVKNIFQGLLWFAFGICALISIMFRVWGPVVWCGVITSFIWLAILSHIFNSHNLKYILNATFFYLASYISIILLCYGHGSVVLGYILPIILIVDTAVQYMIVFIGRAFRTYSVSLLTLAILSFVLLIIAFIMQNIIMPYICFACAILGLVSVVGMWIFKKNELKKDLKKKFHA